MLEALISSKTRIKLLLKFFVNSDNVGYLRGLEAEFGESTNAIRQELNRMEDAGLLHSFADGNKKFFQANTRHPLYQEIHTILLKHLGIDQIIQNVVERLGNIEKVYLAGSFARGLDSQIIDLVLIGDVDKNYLLELVEKAEKVVKRKIRYLLFSPVETDRIPWDSFGQKPLLLWAQ